MAGTDAPQNPKEVDKEVIADPTKLVNDSRTNAAITPKALEVMTGAVAGAQEHLPKTDVGKVVQSDSAKPSDASSNSLADAATRSVVDAATKYLRPDVKDTTVNHDQLVEKALSPAGKRADVELAMTSVSDLTQKLNSYVSGLEAGIKIKEREAGLNNSV